MKTEIHRISIWKKLLKSKTALAGLIIIGVAFFVSVFAYAIAPDNSPDADLQTVEIQSMRPGHSQLFFRQPQSNFIPTDLIRGLFHGLPARYKYIPITDYHTKGDSILLTTYVDEGITAQAAYSLTALGAGAQSLPEQLIVRRKFLLGTDAFGRDILSRLIVGTRVSMTVGTIAVFISLTIGLLLGALAGYYRGKTDAVIMWLINVTWSIPTLLLVFAVTLSLGKGSAQIYIAVGLTLWVSVARLVRGQVMAMKEREFIQAARALGFKDSRIIGRHILPNIIGPVLVVAAGNFATAIIIEAGLSFLGIGVQPPQPSWGLMIKENYNLIITHNAIQALIPGIAIMLLVLAFNFVGNGLRDAFDVKN